MKWIFTLVVVLSALTGIAQAVDTKDEFPAAGDESAKYQQEVVIKGLDNPSGLVNRTLTEPNAVQEFYFAESGAGSVRVFSADRPSATHEVLNGLETRALSSDVPLNVGPWSLGFVTPTKLAVWNGIEKDGIKRVDVYVLPTDGKTISGSEAEHTAELPKGDLASGDAAFPGLVMGETSAYLSSGSAEDVGTLFKAALIANRLDAPRTLTPSKQNSAMHWPTGLCLSTSTRTQFLVAAYVGQLNKERDSRVAFVVPTNGDVALVLTPGLFDVVGLAYSPTGQLYAADLSWEDEKAGGIYRLDDARLDGQPACRAVKIAEIVRPTSLVFDASGAMYVTSLGTGTNEKQGSIVKITGEF
jgi:hypothetical protein